VANTWEGAYDPIFYANEAIEALHASMGLAQRVHRGYEEEWKGRGKGETISIPVPSTFEATDVNTSTGGTTQDVDTDEVQISLSTWKEVKFKVTEKKLSLGPDKIIEDHIKPAGVAIADAIDKSLVGLIDKVPNYADFSSDPAWADLTGARGVLRNLGVPMNDGKLHMMVDSDIEASLLGMSQFTNAGYAGANDETLMSGFIGRRLGTEFFANQNTPLHTTGAMSDAEGTLTASAGDKTVTFAGLTDNDTVKEGDIFTVAGDDQKYVVTEDGTVGSGTSTELTVGIFPALQQDADGAVVTFENGTSATEYSHNLMFHENAFALAMAPLTEEGASLGAQIGTVTDPVTGLALRSRMFYDGDHNVIKVAIDALWGVKLLAPNRATRVRRATA